MTEPLSEEMLRYNRSAVIHRIYASVLYHMVKTETTCEQLAVSLSYAPEKMKRLLDHPEEWTLHTLSDLLLAMRAEGLVHLAAFDPSLRASSLKSQVAG